MLQSRSFSENRNTPFTIPISMCRNNLVKISPTNVVYLTEYGSLICRNIQNGFQTWVYSLEIECHYLTKLWMSGILLHVQLDSFYTFTLEGNLVRKVPQSPIQGFLIDIQWHPEIDICWAIVKDRVNVLFTSLLKMSWDGQNWSVKERSNINSNSTLDDIRRQSSSSLLNRHFTQTG